MKIIIHIPAIYNNNVFINTSEGNIPLQVFGEHNLSNIEAAKKICNGTTSCYSVVAQSGASSFARIGDTTY